MPSAELYKTDWLLGMSGLIILIETLVVKQCIPSNKTVHHESPLCL